MTPAAAASEPGRAAGLAEARLAAVVRVLAVAVLACLACSWRLWLSDRLYPLVPLVAGVPRLPAPFDVVALAAFVGLIGALAIRPRSRLLVAAVVAGFVVFFVQDRSRMWPSFYEFCLLLLVVATRHGAGGPAAAAGVLAGLQFVVAAVYFWGGVQKLTPRFFHEEFPWFVAPMAEFVPQARPWLPAIAVVAACGEALAGVGLCTVRFRRLALGELLVMHLVIAVCIGPLRQGWNLAAWLWSLASAVLAWLLFHRTASFSPAALVAGPLGAVLPRLAVLILVGLLPVLDNLNRWDSALSFNVYTGNVSRARILLPPAAVARLPAELAVHVGREQDWAVLDPDAWSMRQFNAGVYPARPVFRAILATVCRQVSDPAVRLVVVEKAGWGIPSVTRVEACGGAFPKSSSLPDRNRTGQAVVARPSGPIPPDGMAFSAEAETMAVRHLSRSLGGRLGSGTHSLVAAALAAANALSGLPLAAAPWAAQTVAPTPSVLVRPAASRQVSGGGAYETAPESAAAVSAGPPLVDPDPLALHGGSWEGATTAPVRIVQEPLAETVSPGVSIDDGEPLPLTGCDGTGCPGGCQACRGAGGGLCEPFGLIQRMCDVHAGTNACWTARADALILFRNAPSPRPVYDFVNPPNVAAIDANELNSPAAAGGRLSLLRRECNGDAWEAAYLYGGQFFATQAVPFVAGGYLTSAPGIFGNDFPPVNFLDSAAARLTASIQSAELNRRWWVSRNCQLLAGFRWLQWYESATVSDTYGSGTPSAGSDIYTNSCVNNLFGGQLGIDSLLYRSAHGLRLEGLVKAGAYGNCAGQNSSYVNLVGGAPFYTNSVGVTQTPASCSFVGEVGLTGVVPIACNWDFRVGYVGLWVTGLAQPMRQLSGQSLAPGEPTSGTLAAVGTAVVQGVSLGLEGRW